MLLVLFGCVLLVVLVSVSVTWLGLDVGFEVMIYLFECICVAVN